MLHCHTAYINCDCSVCPLISYAVFFATPVSDGNFVAQICHSDANRCSDIVMQNSRMHILYDIACSRAWNLARVFPNKANRNDDCSSAQSNTT